MTKRITRQVRIAAEYHQRLKVAAEEHHTTVSKFLGRICRHYFEEVEPKIKTRIEAIKAKYKENQGIEEVKTT